MISSDEKQKVARSMIRCGGSFVSALGNALLHADLINTQKIKNAFGEYWKQYQLMSEKGEYE